MMKIQTISFLSCAAYLGLFSVSQGAIAWTEDFSGYASGADPDGMTTTTGNGTNETVNNVEVNGSNQLLYTADGGTERYYVTTPDANATFGSFMFDIGLVSEPVGASATADRIFLQFFDGTTFDSGALSVPHFNTFFDASNAGATVGGVLVTMKYYFNATGVTQNYTAPDGSTEPLPTDRLDIWAGTTRITNNGTPSFPDGIPTNVDSIAFATFNGQTGHSYVMDNFSYDAVITIPELSTSLILVFGLSAMTGLRRRK
ncbi:hypothetical protein N9F50_01125 [Akkermansiaceae bacterium]|nr:hypothetical protein [Akkermansiaceae bacterium]MDB4419049.1 hypothetical protein [bacterium]